MNETAYSCWRFSIFVVWFLVYYYILLKSSESWHSCTDCEVIIVIHFCCLSPITQVLIIGGFLMLCVHVIPWKKIGWAQITGAVDNNSLPKMKWFQCRWQEVLKQSCICGCFSSTRLYTSRGTLAIGNSSASWQTCVSFRGLEPGIDLGTLSEEMNFFAGHQFRASGDFNRWSAVMINDWLVDGWLRSSRWWMGFFLSLLLPLLHYCSCRVGLWHKQVNLWLACMHVLEDTCYSPSLLVYPLRLLFLLRLEVGICWPLGCNHKNWRMDFQSYWGCRH